MKLSFYKKTLDNVTVVMIALEGLERHFNSLELKWAAETSLVEPKKSKPTYKM